MHYGKLYFERHNVLLQLFRNVNHYKTRTNVFAFKFLNSEISGNHVSDFSAESTNMRAKSRGGRPVKR